MSTLHDAEAIGVLSDPVRMRLYRHVSESREPISREEAAQSLGLSISKVKFHLDRLADSGLLEVEYRRLGEKQGPGAGRPTKLYRRAHAEFSVSLPERRYDIMGGILAQAVERTRQGESLEAAIELAAYDLGSVSATPVADTQDPMVAAASALTALGYEAVRDGDTLRLCNCPFDALAQEHRDLVCNTNQHYVQGVLDQAAPEALVAKLDPCPGYCCVTASSPKATRSEP